MLQTVTPVPSADGPPDGSTFNTEAENSNLSTVVIEVTVKVHSAYLCCFLNSFTDDVTLAVASAITRAGVMCMCPETATLPDTTNTDVIRRWYTLKATSPFFEFLLNYSVVALSPTARQAFLTSDGDVVVHISQYMYEVCFPLFQCWQGCPFCDGVYRPPCMLLHSADDDVSYLDSDEEPWNAFKVASTPQPPSAVLINSNAKSFDAVQVTETSQAQSPERVKRAHSYTPEQLKPLTIPQTCAAPTCAQFDSPKRVKQASPVHHVSEGSTY